VPAKTRKRLEQRALGARAALGRIEQLRKEDWLPQDTGELLCDIYEHRCQALTENSPDEAAEHEERYAALRRLHRELVLAEREAPLRLRETGEISDEAMRRVQRDLDLTESLLED
jgi:hypothetical protein